MLKKTESKPAVSTASAIPPSEMIPQFNCRLPQPVKNDIKKLKKALKLRSEGHVVAKAIRHLKAATAAKARA